jgi:hypothetical protein
MNPMIYRDLGIFNSGKGTLGIVLATQLNHTAVNIALDVFFATLPIPIIWNLRVRKRTRVCLILILGLGFTYGLAVALSTSF